MNAETNLAPHETRLSFSRKYAKLQLAWDSTSLGALKRCARYYEYNIIEGYTTRNESAHLRFGIEYNNALVTYQQSIADGADYETAVLAAVRYALTQTWDEKLGRPWHSDEPTKNRESLVRSVIWYLDKFKEDPLATVILETGKPAVELSFRLHVDMKSSLSGEDYLLCGYLDRKVNFGGYWYTDFKTTKGMLDDNYFSKYTPNNQVSQYAFAGTIVSPEPIRGIIIDAAQVAVTFTRFQRAEIPRNPEFLSEWFEDAKVYIRQNEGYVARNHWPMNDTACDMYGGCPYRVICSMSPELRQKHLDAMYVRRTWDPLRVREI
jgi:hypothetical protein